VTFGPDGTLITGGNDRTIRIWGADGGRKLAIFPGAAE
jgi:WD40 repeat protein